MSLRTTSIKESIQWNWKMYLKLKLDLIDISLTNPFNGIERLGLVCSTSITVSGVESIQWNWKAQDVDKACLERPGSLNPFNGIESFLKVKPDLLVLKQPRIHSMELKAGSSPWAPGLSSTLRKNPFNGIESAVFNPSIPHIFRLTGIHSMELKEH